MDEVDKIIIHSLREIGCPMIDEEVTSIAAFTPEMIVRATADCLQQIKPNAALPTFLPAGMALRFATATALAKECASCGYRNDIGYQSFLYPNTVDVRRLFMFLIEQLPKESIQKQTDTLLNKTPLGRYELLRREIKTKIKQQLHTPWVPQYCRLIGNQRQSGTCSSMHLPFAPQLNLNIPNTVDEIPTELRTYLQQQAPNIFQQTTGTDHDLISTVLHRNTFDLYDTGILLGGVPEALKYSKIENALTPQHAQHTEGIINNKVVESSHNETQEMEKEKKVKTMTKLEKLNEDINTLRNRNDDLLADRKLKHSQLNNIKIQAINLRANIESLRCDAKVHERTCLVLENPIENVEKLTGLIDTTIERRKTLEQQWQTYRKPLVLNLEKLQTSKQAKNAQNVADLREIIIQLEQTLRARTNLHAELVMQLKTAEISVAPRKEYTRRILEFIGNIRKQRNDIFKVLDDTRDLQKQLNSVTGQLQRQFNYTDDLLFQSAKHDMHAKKAYKLLASLHATCNDLVELVTQTGNITKEIRDLEEHIDRERAKNIAVSLEQISADIRNFENVIKSVQFEIRKVENDDTSSNLK